MTVLGVEGPLGAWARNDPGLNQVAYAAAGRCDDPSSSIHMVGVGYR